tara:strand:- start:320 stop:481 length:162 start_codon:yes stop_codon:yes gene_type:complete
MKVRIQWESLLTGIKCHGDWFNSDEQHILEDTIKFMNQKYNGEIKHWLEKKSL